jgi:predicted MFS family arabinose efflux permease
MPSPLSELKSSSRGFKVSIAEGAVTVLGSALAGPMATPLLLRLGADANALGLYTALVSATTPPLQLAAAVLLDRYRERRPHIMWAFAAAGRAMWLGVLAVLLTGWGGLWAVMAFLYASNALGVFAGLAWTDLMADLVEPQRRGRMFALRNTILGFVNIAGLLIAKPVYDGLGYPAGYVLAISAGTALMLAAVPLLYMYGDPTRPRGLGLGVRGALSALKNREVLRDSAALSFWSFSVNIVAGIWNYHMYAAFHADESWFTTLNLIGGVVGTLANPPWGSFYDRFGPRATFLVSGLGIVAVPALFPFLPSLLGQSALQVYSTTLWTGFNLASFNYAVSYSGQYRHVYIAVYNILPSIAAALGTMAGVQMYNALGVSAFFASAVGRLLALTVLYKVASARGATYEELRVASHLYPLYLAGRQVAQATYIEFIYALRVLYAAVLTSFLVAALAALYAVLLRLLGG